MASAREVRLFLIRHGETVDNVASVYAGSKDSELTNHGYQQATLLGRHFRYAGVQFTHIFSSQLQRAAKTAALIRELQSTVEVVQSPLLAEQDFGFYEGKKFYERPSDSKSTGKERHREEHKNAAGFADVESKESMAQRADAFLDGHLLSVLESPTHTRNLAIAIVSHGIMLGVLWKRLLARLPPQSVRFAPEIVLNTNSPTLEHLGGWSNTGYLELFMQNATLHSRKDSPAAAPNPTSKSAPSEGVSGQACDAADIVAINGEEEVSNQKVDSAIHNPYPKLLRGWQTVIETVNGRDHLKGLKRTRGGVGSSRYDPSQKSLDSFFKKRRVD